VGKPLAVSYRHLAGGEKKKQIDIQTVVFIRTRDEFACPITSHGHFQPFNKSLSSLSDQHHLLGWWETANLVCITNTDCRR
jgi:hypothetical protein